MREMASRICAWLVVKSTDGPGGGTVTSARRSSGAMLVTNCLSDATGAPQRVRVDVVAIDHEHDEAPGPAIGVVRHVRIARLRGLGRGRAAVGDEFGADDAPRLPVDGDREFRHAQIAHRHPLRVDDRDIDFHHFDARSEDRRLIGLREQPARSGPATDNATSAERMARIADLLGENRIVMQYPLNHEPRFYVQRRDPISAICHLRYPVGRTVRELPQHRETAGALEAPGLRS